MFDGIMKAIAPGKLILGGEHAVVYGRPALAMAMNRNAQAILSTTGTDGEVSFDLPDMLEKNESFTLRTLRDVKDRVQQNYELFQKGELSIRDVLHKPVDLFQYAFITVLDGLHLKMGHGVNIRLNSNIPIGCGMGSSAATILSVLRAMGHYFRTDFRPDWYYRYSMEVENMQHGKASGLDTYVSIHGGCVRFQEGVAEELPLPRVPLYIVNTGTPACATGETVSAVARHFNRTARIWDDFEGVVRRMQDALAANNLKQFQQSVRENHRLLCDIGVVPQKVASFIQDIEATGAAAKICGAGAASGDEGGIVMVSSTANPKEICDRYGYTVMTVRPDPLGVRII